MAILGIKSNVMLYWLSLVKRISFNLFFPFLCPPPPPLKSKICRILPIWCHSVLKLRENFHFMIIFLLSKNEVICSFQKKIIYIFILCSEYGGEGLNYPLSVSFEPLIVEKRQTPFWKQKNTLLFYVFHLL